jgi:hypothetical protein
MPTASGAGWLLEGKPFDLSALHLVAELSPPLDFRFLLRVLCHLDTA